MTHNDWLRSQVNKAMSKLDTGAAVFFSNAEVKQIMSQRKAKARGE